MEVQVALRVIRGPDWHFGDEDGGEGCVGSVVATKTSEVAGTSAVVIWDNGNRGDYSCGVDGKYDLRVLDSSPSGIIHRNVSCDACVHTGITRENIVGFRWKCGSCHDFDLCTSCYMKNKHNTRHRFVLWTRGKPQSLCPTRADSKDRQFYPQGIFAGAEVVRGADWEYGTRDGGAGSVGTVIEGDVWKLKGLVQVEWPNKDKGRYRVGHQAKVDLEFTKPSILVSSYYADHLPILGAPPNPIGPREFVVGDVVRVELDTEMFELMQEGHGGWSDSMSDLRNRMGIVFSIDHEDDLRVRYEDKAFYINPEAVVKVGCPLLERGEIVRVMEDREEMVKMQKGFGGWNEDMTELLGRAAVVRDINEGIIHIYCNGSQWAVCPLSLRQAEDITEDEKHALIPTSASVLWDDREPDIVQQLHMKMLLLKTVDTENSEILTVGALLDDKDTVEAYLKKFPNDINAKHSNKTAIHCATSVGSLSMIKMLLEYNANVDILDGDGMSILHIAAMKGYAEVTSLLLDHGADPNIVNDKGHTPIVTAVTHGQAEVVRALAKHESTNLCAQNLEGESAVHIAVHIKELDCLKELIIGKADLSCVNFKLEKPIHLAVVKDFPEAVKEMLLAEPELVNSRNDENCVPLHLAAGLNREEITQFLLKQALCDMEAKSTEGFTPLHGAVIKGEPNMVELLVTHGANVNSADKTGDTPLHLSFSTPKARIVHGATTPILTEIRQDLLKEHAFVETYVVVACFLILQGANRSLLNYSGITAMEKHPLQLSIVEKYVAEKSMRGATWIKAVHGSSEDCTHTAPVCTEAMKSVSHEKQVSNVHQHCLQTNCSNQVTENLVQDNAMALHSQLNVSDLNSQDVLSTTETPSTSPNTSHLDDNSLIPEQQVCRLCDNIVTIKMEPCGHKVVCQVCAKRATKCLLCRKPVMAVVNI